MDNKRYQNGLARLAEVDGQAGEHVIQSLQHIAPDLGRYIIEFAFGDIYRRPLLALEGVKPNWMCIFRRH